MIFPQDLKIDIMLHETLCSRSNEKWNEVTDMIGKNPNNNNDNTNPLPEIKKYWTGFHRSSKKQFCMIL